MIEAEGPDERMTTVSDQLRKWKIWIDCSGQDLTDYALFAGFVVVISAAIWPVVANSIGEIFTKLGAALSAPPAGSVK